MSCLAYLSRATVPWFEIIKTFYLCVCCVLYANGQLRPTPALTFSVTAITDYQPGSTYFSSKPTWRRFPVLFNCINNLTCVPMGVEPTNHSTACIAYSLRKHIIVQIYALNFAIHTEQDSGTHKRANEKKHTFGQCKLYAIPQFYDDGGIKKWRR